MATANGMTFIAATVFVSPDGSTWIGTDQSGVFMLSDGAWTHWSGTGDGLGNFHISDIAFDFQEKVWAATSAGLSYLQSYTPPAKVRVSIYTSEDIYGRFSDLVIYMDIHNETEYDLNGCLYTYLEWPDGSKHYLPTGYSEPYRTTTTLSAGQSSEGEVIYTACLETFFFMDEGLYAWHVSLFDEATGALLDSDSCTFTLSIAGTN